MTKNEKDKYLKETYKNLKLLKEKPFFDVINHSLLDLPLRVHPSMIPNPTPFTSRLS